MRNRRSPARLITALATIGALTVGAAGCQVDGQPAIGHGASLQESYAAAQLPAGVGVALLPLGGTQVLTFGDQTSEYAWSTIKVPLALAAQRHAAGESADVRADIDAAIESAIVDSDNDAALALRESLGTPDQARARVTAVLREGGDGDVQLAPIDDPEDIFGLTRWPLAGSARFAARLPCMPGSQQILGFMGEVSAEQEWGLHSISAPGVHTAMKGGWGEADEVRQLGLITWPDGRQLAVAMLSSREGETTGEGIAELDRVAQWLQENLEALPRGRCD
ncbi:hypothetical protein MUG78_00985 [Gordonia alkaliphila]|uniref:hypothetical protein n=1 Tax=Gordonia alkaliphila TaxID=1053547 RepID=UPI001FF1586B|nr:hypothetical protein [Gordonia alkaliphila]MCK0438069.1 hypothetical protein [Gordonia alkaliphila]